MQKVIQMFVLAAMLLLAAFFANYYGIVSIPWLDINHIPTYGDDARHSNDAAQKVFE